MAVLAPPRPHSHDDLEALVKEARQRQLRRRLFAAAGIAVAAATALGVYALIGGFGGIRSAGSSANGGPPLCRSSQLSTSAMIGAAAGTTFLPVVIANTSRQACALPEGRPDLQVMFRGRAVPIKEQLLSAIAPFGRPAGRVLATGMNAFVELTWRDWCPHPAAAAETGAVHLVLRFGDGVRITAPESSPDVPGPALPACGEVSQPQPVAVSRLLRDP